MSNIELNWTEPPTQKRGPSMGKRTVIREALKARPGEWALVAEDAWTAGWAAEGFEVTTRSAGHDYKKGRADIYMRYIGEDVEA